MQSKSPILERCDALRKDMSLSISVPVDLLLGDVARRCIWKTARKSRSTYSQFEQKAKSFAGIPDGALRRR